MKNILKYTILGLFILNLPEIGLAILGSTVGGLLSYFSFILLGVYYVFFLRGKPNLWLLYIGLAYFIISGFQMYNGVEKDFLIEVAKYLILVLFGNSFFKEISRKEMLLFLLIGSITVILNAFVFPDNYGRYSGFYLNPNAAGFITIIGYCLSYSMKNKRLKTFYQVIFTLAGILTFSRTFVLLWLLTNLIALKINLKNLRVLGLGIVLITIIFTFGEILNLGGQRYEIFKAVLNSDDSAPAASGIEKDSRTETWALFYDEIFLHPFFGDGYGKFQGGGIHRIGPHNTYILIAGEAGIFPLLLFIIFTLYLCYSSYKIFDKDPSCFFISVVLILYLSTSHTYFNSFIKLSITLFLYNRLLEVQNNQSYIKEKNSDI
ncbi:hypothetical protein LCGC14_1636580, partial [marine sediment metagenome]